MDIKEMYNTLKQKITPAKIFFFITLCLVIFVRLRLLSMPLDRDEGGWAYAAWLILNGEPPFKYFYDTKMPGIYYIYVLITIIFGQTIEGIRIGILFTVFTNIFLIYKTFMKISNDSERGLMACSFYGLLSLDSGTMSLSGYSTHFVLTFVMLSLIFLLNALKQNNGILFFIGGLFSGLSFGIKQTAIVFALFFLIFIFVIQWINKIDIKKIFIFLSFYSAGFALIFLTICLIMKTYGVFDRFWFMTVDYALKYSNAIKPNDAKNYLMISFGYLSIFFKSFIAIYGVYFITFILFAKNLEKKILHSLLLISAILFSVSGFYFYPHYFIVFSLPVSIVLSEKIPKIEKDRITNIVFLLMFVLLIFNHYNIFFKLSPDMVSRNIFNINPFPESKPIAGFIINNTDKEDKIAILGSEPQILFYSKRKSATGYVYFNQLMQDNELSFKMQKEAIKEIEESSPEYLIYVNVPTSWAMNSKSSTRIFEWFKNKFNNKKLELEGIVNIVSPDKTEYIWGKDAEKYRLLTPYWIAVFKMVH